MPRNSGGTYSLPAGNPVVTATVISSVWANTTLSDIGTAMTDSLSRSGQGGMTAQLGLFAGLIGAPGLSWTAETTSGLYRAGAGDFRYSIAGVDVWKITASGVTSGFADGTQPLPSIYFTSDPDTGIYRVGANSAALVAGGITAMGWDTSGIFSFPHAYALDGLVGTPAFTFINDPDTGFYRRGANDFAATAGGVLVAAFTSASLNMGLPISSARILGSVGSAPLPEYSFTSDPDTGMYRAGADNLRIAAGGVDVWGFATVAGVSFNQPFGVIQGVIDGTAGTPLYSFNNDPDTGIYRVTTNQLGIAAGGILIADFYTGGVVFTNTVGSQVQVPDGTALLPGLAFSSDGDTGIFRNGANRISIAAGGAEIATALVDQFTLFQQLRAVDGLTGTPGVSFSSDPDTGMWRSGANDLRFSAGAVFVLQIATSGGYLLNQSGNAAGPSMTFLSDPDTGFYNDTANQIGIGLGGVTAGQIAQGSFTGTLTGMTGATTGTVNYQRMGKRVMLTGGTITGTSNSVNMTMTGMPAIITPASGVDALVSWATDNAVTTRGAIATISSSGIITFNLLTVSGSVLTAGFFTNSGTKGLFSGFLIVYLLP